MARIRSVKPQFWTSEQVAECSPNARLLFIGLWNFCDDYGIHPASVKRAKMEIFPSDDFCSADIRRMVDELIANGLLEEYEIAESQYWRVTGWDKHQKPDTKTGLYPMPDGQVGGKIRRQNAEESKPIRRTVAEHSPPEKEKEKEKENTSVGTEKTKHVVTFSDGAFSGINGFAEVWSKAFPAIDIESETAKAAAWLVANPKNKKSNYARFLTNWFSRSQDKAPAQGSGQSSSLFAGAI
jgi:hypothetical protein